MTTFGRRITFGLIGYGAIGALRAQALEHTPGVRLGMIAEPVDERRAAAAAKHRAPTTRALDEMLADPQIDAVVVSTPPNLHHAHCVAALRAGKHVLCEKPLAPTLEQARDMVAVAQACGKALATGFNYRFYPGVMRARELIAQGQLGEIVYVKSYAGHPGGPEFTHAWVHNPEIVGGGALMDNGIHVADLTLHFLGTFAASCGLRSESVWQFAGSEDNGFVLARSEDGRIGMLHASWSAWRGYQWRVEVCATKGALEISYPPMLLLHYERPDGAAKHGRRRLHTFPVFQIQERLRSYRWTVVQSLIAEQVDFVARLQGKTFVGATGADGLHAVELAQSAYRDVTVAAPVSHTGHFEMVIPFGMCNHRNFSNANPSILRDRFYANPAESLNSLNTSGQAFGTRFYAKCFRFYWIREDCVLVNHIVDTLRS
ncbi:MAG: Gfo/Idh/MocA family oxidoreductase [Chloroflexi bacterium]|nr:Gfo/Idh/MocA family oxidoreductase [Chloroflexota bacterium]